MNVSFSKVFHIIFSFKAQFFYIQLLECRSSPYKFHDLMVSVTLFSPDAQDHQTKEYGVPSPHPEQSQTLPVAVLQSRSVDLLMGGFSI